MRLQCSQKLDSHSEGGSASLLGILLTVPLLLFFLGVTLDLATFFRCRAAIISAIDSAAIKAIRYPDVAQSSLNIELLASSELWRPTVTLDPLLALRQAGSATISVAGWYQPLLANLLPLSPEMVSTKIPFFVSSKARRLQSEVVLVLDRSVAQASTECSDESFIQRRILLKNLVRGFQKRGVGKITIGVWPSTQTIDAADISSVSLKLDEANRFSDNLPRCASLDEASTELDRALNLKGEFSLPISITDADIAESVLNLIVADRNTLPITKQTVLLISSGRNSNIFSLTSLSEALRESISNGGMSYTVRQVSVDSADHPGPKSVQKTGYDGRVLSVSTGDSTNSTLTVALLMSNDAFVLEGSR